MPESSSLYVSFTTYYINESNKDANFGNQIVDEVKNPIQKKITFQTKPTSVKNNNPTPEEFTLQNVYPNPFEPNKGNALFRVKIPNGTQDGKFTIFNLLGQIVKKVNLSNLDTENGIFEFNWNGLQENGSFLPAGIYFYQIRIDDQIQTKKMLLL